MPAEALIEIPPEFETDPLAHDRDRLRPFRSRPVPPHRDEPALARRTSPHGKEGVHPQFAHRFLVERLHLDPELLQRFGALGEFDGKEDIGRFVDQIAGQFDAFGNSEALLPGCPRRSGVARADDKIGRLEAIVPRFLLARLVFIESVGAQAKAEGKIGGCRAVPRSRRRLEGDFDPLRPAHFAEGEAAKGDEVDGRVVLSRRDADNDEP